ncbi:MAG: TRAP transporter small permease [Gammaproteobacteria bacterium]|nr:TRAP transporter small permease [Gammaproteobacteria bacterium]
MPLAETGFQKIAGHCAIWSHWLSRGIEIAVVGLMVLLVLDVWLGVLVRYFVDFPLTFTEEAARYLMIWMALLAVSIGIARREHIGVLILFDHTRGWKRHLLLAVFDVLGLFLFLFLFYYGIEFTLVGARRLTMIYDMPKSIPFAAVPVSCLIAAIQIVLVAVRDQAKLLADPGQESALS